MHAAIFRPYRSDRCLARHAKAVRLDPVWGGGNVSFIKIEEWVERPTIIPIVERHVSDRRWLSKGLALAASAATVAGLMLALLALGTRRTPFAVHNEHGIMTFDISSSSPRPQDVRAPAAIAVPKHPIPPASAPPIIREWSITTLPPIPKIAPVQSEIARTVPLPISAQGPAAAGSGTSGYDPYAFASYQKPDAARLARASSAPPLQPLPEAVARLSAAILRKTRGPGAAVSVRATVDASGHVVRAELLAPGTPDLTIRLARFAPGFALCAPDPMRGANAELIVTLIA